jgi:hypothetical protein
MKSEDLDRKIIRAGDKGRERRVAQLEKRLKRVDIAARPSRRSRRWKSFGWNCCVPLNYKEQTPKGDAGVDAWLHGPIMEIALHWESGAVSSGRAEQRSRP